MDKLLMLVGLVLNIVLAGMQFVLYVLAMAVALLPWILGGLLVLAVLL